MGGAYIHLHAHSAFSFLDGASLPGDLVARAAALGQGTLALTDWCGVYGAPGINDAQKKALTDMVLAALKTKSWQESLENNDWTPAVMSGPDFAKFVDDEFASLRAIMAKSGMI